MSGCSCRTRFPDFFQDLREMIRDHFVGEMQDAQSHCGKNLIPFGVKLLLPKVDFSVYFDDQACRVAKKIYDEPGDDLLAAEMEAA